MSDEENKEVKEGEVLTKEQSASELDAIGSLLQGVVTPFAQAQETSEKEATKRVNILAGVANKAIYALFGISALILALSAFALSQGSEVLAEKMVIALLAFFGGLGAGKATNK